LLAHPTQGSDTSPGFVAEQLAAKVDPESDGPASLLAMTFPGKAIGVLGCLLTAAAFAGCGEAAVPTGGRPAAVVKTSSAPGSTIGAGTADPGGATTAKTGGATDPPGGEKSSARGGTAGATTPKTGKTPPASAADASGDGVTHEVADPEEANSFPVAAASVQRHRAAGSPSAAGEAVVAPGAQSDAEVRKELGEEERVKARERAAQQRALTPVAGGFSVGGNGTIPIPSGVPEAVQRVVAGGNAIANFPYIWGGGHASFIANGYDCSGSVSYALAAGGLLSAPLVSGDLANWGEPGPGHWITIYANAGHTFMNVDGVWFDTAGRSGPYASRWLVSTPSLAGYAVRHPPGL
jgi:cell wall-associated NlpC family hydrolase